MSDDIINHIALIDLDGTVANYAKAIRTEMSKLMSPNEEPYVDRYKDGRDEPEYIKERRRLVQNKPGFWLGLEKIDLGFQIVEDLKEIGFTLNILSKAPRACPGAWSEKTIWCKTHLPDCKITLSEEKYLVYGMVLVDDWPKYFTKWLKVRPRGLVVCVKQPWNEDVEHPNVIIYDGSNRDELKNRLRDVFNRRD